MTLQLLAPLTLIIGLSNVMGIQILYPQGKEHLVMISTGVGAVVNFCMNLFLIPLYGSGGAAISTLIAEVCVTTTMAIIGAKYFPFKYFTRQNSLVLLSAAMMFAVCIFAVRHVDSDVLKLLIIPTIGVVVYAACMFLSKTPIAMETYGMIKKRFFDRNK